MRDFRTRLVGAAVMLFAGGALFQVGGCSVAGLRSYISTLNPCVAILACDPVSWRFLTSGYQGPGANPNVDPACTYPPFCVGDPFVQTTATTP